MADIASGFSEKLNISNDKGSRSNNDGTDKKEVTFATTVDCTYVDSSEGGPELVNKVSVGQDTGQGGRQKRFVASQPEEPKKQNSSSSSSSHAPMAAANSKNDVNVVYLRSRATKSFRPVISKSMGSNQAAKKTPTKLPEKQAAAAAPKRKQNGISQTCSKKARVPQVVVYSCGYCSFETLKRRNFNMHKEKHTQLGPERCRYCTYSTTKPSQLDQHIATHFGHFSEQTVNDGPVPLLRIPAPIGPFRKHASDQSFCKLCDRKFENKEACRVHMAAHIGFTACISKPHQGEAKGETAGPSDLG